MTYSVRRALVVGFLACVLGIGVGSYLCQRTGNPFATDHEPTNVETGDGVLVPSDDGVSYTPESARNLVSVTLPRPGERVTFPILVRGEARGTWFFEATAPMDLVNQSGRIVGGGFVTAEGEWMTEDFVPFSGLLRLTDEENLSDRGYLILRKDNPSGLPQYDASIEIPVKFR